jgi:N-acylneuraminate cytidylyltransferase
VVDGNKILAVIPARGGSKGVPRKNLRSVGGKPLLAWTIEAAKLSKYIDRLVISSEDLEIIETARQWGCEAPFVRPIELALDHTPGIAPVLHALEVLPERYDYVVLLQPTSPLRTVADIDGCIELCVDKGANSCVSVTESAQSPFWMYTMDGNGAIQPLIKMEQQYSRRQDTPRVYALNGAVYVNACGFLQKARRFVTPETIGYVMPPERSLDIDTELDLAIVDYLLTSSIGLL